MINQQLLDYVRAQRSAGLSKEAIAQALAAGGWTLSDVEQAIMALDGIKTPPPPPPPAPPPQGLPGPRVIVPPPGGPAVEQPAIGGPGVAPMPQPIPRPRMSNAEFGTAPVRRKRSSLSFILLLVVLAVVVGGGAMIYLDPSKLDVFKPYFKSFFPEMIEIDEPTDTTPIQPAPSTTTVPLLPDATTTASTTASTTLLH